MQRTKIHLTKKGIYADKMRKGRNKIALSTIGRMHALINNRLVHWHMLRVALTRTMAPAGKGLKLDEDC